MTYGASGLMVINMLWSLVLKERSRTYEDKTDRIL